MKLFVNKLSPVILNSYANCSAVPCIAYMDSKMYFNTKYKLYLTGTPKQTRTE